MTSSEATMSDGTIDMDISSGPRQTNTIRSFNGCWTCRLRRKKCDQKHPVCDGCAALHITCHFNQDRPEWMDGGVKQEEMAERVKREVKENAHLRRGERVLVSGDRLSLSESDTSRWTMQPQKLRMDQRKLRSSLINGIPDVRDSEMELHPEPSTIFHQRGADCTLAGKAASQSIDFGRADTVHLMIYLEELFPFLFPFYHPSFFQGGRSWILEMMTSSPVVRQALLCQSSYFFSLGAGAANRDACWTRVLTETRDAFGVLRQALQIIEGSSITEHRHGAVRILASIIQVQRFEITISSFENCQAHLTGALALFKQLLDTSDAAKPPCPSSRFEAVISKLGPSPIPLSAPNLQIPSAEQAAFRFSSALLILDDIIASTVLQEEPRLYEYHRSFLEYDDGTGPVINLEAVVGCQNWVWLLIGEIAVLDAWKKRCQRAANLDVMELVRLASAIKSSLEARLAQLEADPAIVPRKNYGLLDVLTPEYRWQSQLPDSQSSFVTRVWAHAAALYLFVVVSGWQPASVDVRYHVARIIELLTVQISPPALLRTMVWPFCVAGCLAEPAQEACLRGMVEVLQPPSVFGTVRKALEIMENVWRNRDSGETAYQDLATCFGSQGDLVLLV
ncbi:Fungal specific transcription factor domain containing protein [Hyaloscypha variabilis]